MNRVFIWFAVFAVAFGLCLASWQLSYAEHESCMVTELKGTVMVVRAGGIKEFKAFRSMRLNEGDTVRTGASSNATIQVDAEQSFKIAANSEVVVSELKNKNGETKLTLNLRKGGIGNEINKKLKEGSDYKIKTPTAVMGVRGTEFYVQFESGETDVWLTKGVVTMDYRRQGNYALPLTSTQGVREHIVLRAPAKAVLDANHAVPWDVVQKYSSDGLYEEFLQDLMEDADDYEDFLEELEELKEKYIESKKEREDKEAKEEEHDVDDDVVVYEFPAIDDDADDDQDVDDSDDSDDDGDTTIGGIPPRPSGDYVFVKKLNNHGVIRNVDQWLIFEPGPAVGTVIIVAYGHPVVYDKSTMEANDYIIDMLMVP